MAHETPLEEQKPVRPTVVLIILAALAFLVCWGMAATDHPYGHDGMMLIGACVTGYVAVRGCYRIKSKKDASVFLYLGVGLLAGACLVMILMLLGI